MFGLDEEPGPAAFLVNASRIDQPAANDFIGFYQYLRPQFSLSDEPVGVRTQFVTL
jgi:hypothetical protein